MLRTLFGPVAFATGLFGVMLAVAMLIPMLVDVFDGDPRWQGFFAASAGVGVLSGFLSLATRGQVAPYSRRFGFLLVNMLWLASSLIAALPFMLAGPEMSFTDAMFESISGLTTTGSTVMVGLDSTSRGILLWRSLIQWIGGIGILGMGLLLLPFLRVGGMQIFQLESSAKTDNPAAHFSTFALDLILIYLVLTLACVFGYVVTGMTLFDAINHALTTLSTGGYSTHDASFNGASSATRIVAIIFMIAGAMPFVALVRAAVARDIRKAYDTQLPTLIGLIFLLSILLLASGLQKTHAPFASLILDSAFTITSIITTTGYVSSDYLQWGPLAIAAIVLTTYLGGCSGSTAGGIKTYRLIIIYRNIASSLRELLYPNGIFAVSYEGRRVTEQTLRSVSAFVVSFVALQLLATLVLAGLGLDFETAFSGALTAITNTGPGIGEIIGPIGNFSSLPDAAKWVLAVTMLIGRLEIMTMLVLASPVFWRT